MTPIKIDEEFQNLIRPLRSQEYRQLEENICSDGCLNPIILWNGIIVDGHNRYEICTKHNIPFQTINMQFSCRDEAIAWICRNQLGRRNISEETRRYLIGRQYESEKMVLKIKNPLGVNQHSDTPSTANNENIVYKKSPTRHTTAQRIADENHLTHGTVQKYANYTKALDELSKKEPELTRKILSGKYKISYENVLALAQLPIAELRKINQRVERNNLPYMQYSRTRKAIENTDGEEPPKPQKIVTAPSIKDMPEYDPDSTVTELSLTIPMWTSSVKRMETNTNFEIISETAKSKLEDVMLELYKHIEKILLKLREN